MKTIECIPSPWPEEITKYVVREKLHPGMTFKLKGHPELDGIYVTDSTLTRSRPCEGCPFSNGKFSCLIGYLEDSSNNIRIMCSGGDFDMYGIKIRSIDSIVENL